MSEENLFTERDRAQEVCSILISNGYAPLADFRDLLYDENLRYEVEKRLDRVGMKLIHNVYSENWGVGLNDNTVSDDRLDWSNNLGLARGAMALMLILWCKLILPKRLEQESQRSEQGTLGEAFGNLEKKPPPRSTASRDQILTKFGNVLGGSTNTSKYLAQLSRAKLIKTHSGLIEEGPLLSLVIDENNLNDELRKEVLLNVLKKDSQTESKIDDDDDDLDDFDDLDDLEDDNV